MWGFRAWNFQSQSILGAPELPALGQHRAQSLSVAATLQFVVLVCIRVYRGAVETCILLTEGPKSLLDTPSWQVRRHTDRNELRDCNFETPLTEPPSLKPPNSVRK